MAFDMNFNAKQFFILNCLIFISVDIDNPEKKTYNFGVEAVTLSNLLFAGVMVSVIFLNSTFNIFSDNGQLADRCVQRATLRV